MRAFILVLTAVLLVQAVSGLEDYFSIDELTLDATWAGELRASRTSSGQLDSLEARINLIPPGEFTTEPASSIDNGSIIFTWDSFQPRYTYAISSRISSRMEGSLERSTPYPSRVVSDYLDETDLIDYTDPAVRSFAANIASGETDTLRLAVRMADAVRSSVSYNLTSINVDATHPASDVLARGEGVCDEITVLYIAAMRALGVPARYVSGYAYTDIFDEQGSWEGHSWAEVRIGDTWVPFDLTYGEYIQLSPAHLRIRDSEDAAGSRISYTWYGRGVDLQASQLETDVEVRSVGDPVRFGTIDARPVHEEIGPGWNGIEVSVSNDLDSFIAPILRFSRTQGLETPEERTVIVPPRSTRSVTVPVHVTEELRPRYRYTFPISISARGFRDEHVTFSATRNAQRYEEPMVENQAEFHPDLEMTCTDVLGRVDERITSTCALENVGNRNLDVRVCGDSCEDVRILIGESKKIGVLIITREGTNERTIDVFGDIDGSSIIEATGRDPAAVQFHAIANGRMIEVRIENDTRVDMNLTVEVGDWKASGHAERFEVPTDAFWLESDATVRLTYDDVDGPHEMTRVVNVRQNVIDALAVRIERLLSVADSGNT